MSNTANAPDLIAVSSSRLWALFHLNCTRLLFPASMIADHIGVSTVNVDFWLTPWRRIDEHLHCEPSRHGGLEGRTAQGCGLTSLPALLVVGKDGTVASRSTGVGIVNLETQVTKHLGDPAPAKKDTSAAAGHHWPWTR